MKKETFTEAFKIRQEIERLQSFLKSLQEPNYIQFYSQKSTSGRTTYKACQYSARNYWKDGEPTFATASENKSWIEGSPALEGIQEKMFEIFDSARLQTIMKVEKAIKKLEREFKLLSDEDFN